MNGTPARADRWWPLLRADWTRFVFVHFALPPRDLAPYTPLELDCRDGRAFVSLVFFRFEGMRPARFVPGSFGRLLFRPASDSWFLNVRTYVSSGAGPGIQFLIEWMDNPIGLHLGPWLYGLPYRRGRFDCTAVGRDGASCLRVTDAGTGEALRVSVGRDRGNDPPASLAGLELFLLERYTAYTQDRGATRFFHISHPRWRVSRPTVLGIDDRLIRSSCPWFENAQLVSAHASAGFRDVSMGPPRRLYGVAPVGRVTSIARAAPL